MDVDVEVEGAVVGVVVVEEGIVCGVVRLCKGDVRWWGCGCLKGFERWKNFV